MSIKEKVSLFIVKNNIRNNLINDRKILIEWIEKECRQFINDVEENNVTGETCELYGSIWASKSELNTIESIVGAGRKSKDFDRLLFIVSELWENNSLSDKRLVIK